MLVNAAIPELQKSFLTEEQISSSRAIMGLDTQLIDVGTYFVVQQNGALAGCGGWSRRATGLLDGGLFSNFEETIPADEEASLLRGTDIVISTAPLVTSPSGHSVESWIASVVAPNRWLHCSSYACFPTKRLHQS